MLRLKLKHMLKFGFRLVVLSLVEIALRQSKTCRNIIGTLLHDVLKVSDRLRGISIRGVVGLSEVNSPKAQGKAPVMCCPDGNAGEGESHGKKDGDAAQRPILIRCDHGNQRAHD